MGEWRWQWDPLLQPTTPQPRERVLGAGRNGIPAARPYVHQENADEEAAREAARVLAAIRAKLPPEWHAWHATQRPVRTRVGEGATELAWARFWWEAV